MSGIEKGVRLLSCGRGQIKLGGNNISIGTPGEVNAMDSLIEIGDGCDIASFVTITVGDSHGKCLGYVKEIEREPVFIGEHVFIGQGATILGGTRIGHHSVIGAGVVLKGQTIPPHSRVKVPAPIIEPGYYAQRG